MSNERDKLAAEAKEAYLPDIKPIVGAYFCAGWDSALKHLAQQEFPEEACFRECFPEGDQGSKSSWTWEMWSAGAKWMWNYMRGLK